VYDYTFDGDHAWFRFTLMWTDLSSGETRTRAGMQTYRIDGGNLSSRWPSIEQRETLFRSSLHSAFGRTTSWSR
jgi:hypothetical protein